MDKPIDWGHSGTLPAQGYVDFGRWPYELTDAFKCIHCGKPALCRVCAECGKKEIHK